MANTSDARTYTIDWLKAEAVTSTTLGSKRGDALGGGAYGEREGDVVFPRKGTADYEQHRKQKS